MTELRPGVILDRDATLIDVVRDEETGTVQVAFHPKQIRLMPGVLGGLAALADAGFVLAIATNQPGPAKGQISVAAVERTNRALVAMLAEHGIEIAAVEVCMHHPRGGPGGVSELVRACDCRKPQPGLLLSALRRLRLDPARSFMIGDSPGDVLAARAAGIGAALVFSPHRCELCPQRHGPTARPDLMGAQFDEVVAAILAATLR
ncbi:MAG: HAD-IIIA family hydrolase [Polyangiaceae bacterium]|nr:HAD-IIIA family hydrolase [Polyangiaceae bacterium]